MCVYRFSRHPKPRTKRISLPFLYPPPHFFFFFPVTTTANEHKQPAGSGRPTIQALRQENSNYLIKRGQPRQPPPPLLITRRCVYLCACVLFDLCAHRIDTSQQKFETHKRKKERKRSLAIFAFFSSSGIKTSLWKGKVLGRRSEMIEPVFVWRKYLGRMPGQKKKDILIIRTRTREKKKKKNGKKEGGGQQKKKCDIIKRP